jgi:hypothetical protein
MAEHLAGTCAEPARPVISPVTAEHLADLPVVTADQIDRAFAASLPGLVPFGGAAGSRSGWGRVRGLARLRDMTDLRAAIFSLE